MSKLLEALKNLEKDESSPNEILFLKNQNTRKKKNKLPIIIIGIIIVFLGLGIILTKKTLNKYGLNKNTTNIITRNKNKTKENNNNNIKKKSKITKNEKENNKRKIKKEQKIAINKTKEKSDKNQKIKSQTKNKNKSKETKTLVSKQTKNKETQKVNNSIFSEKANFDYLLIAAEEARKKGKYVEALTYYQRYLKNQKKEEPEILNNIGLIYFKLGKIKLAEKFLEKAYQKEKNDIIGQNLLAIYIRTKNKKACQLIEDLEVSNKEKLQNFLRCYGNF